MASLPIIKRDHRPIELGDRTHLDGTWFQGPPGFVARTAQDVSEDAAPRREEGYGDLVGLA
jgi:hypothetical protein